jgi:predicted N-acetyltransferase YhbS
MKGSRTGAITVENLSARPELVADVVEIAWQEWGDALSEAEHAHWLREAERDYRLNTAFSAGFVAVDRGRAVGTVQLHEFDIDAMRDRSPWVCGMVVRPEYRGMHIGRRLLDALERSARERGVERVWVFTEHAAAFYQACGWERHSEAEQDGERGVVLREVL